MLIVKSERFATKESIKKLSNSLMRKVVVSSKSRAKKKDNKAK